MGSHLVQVHFVKRFEGTVSKIVEGIVRVWSQRPRNSGNKTSYGKEIFKASGPNSGPNSG